MNQTQLFQEVYKIVQQIPLGSILTYGQIAQMMGMPRHARVVAKALSQAPAEMKLPCHRVVNQKGELAPDHVFGHQEIQKAMLEAEGILFKENGLIQMKHHTNKIQACNLCPRRCQAHRDLGEKGTCHEAAALHVARAALHPWEEPCISGENGSGTIFFSGCNLGCVYCQNKEISRGNKGQYISVQRLADIMIELQEKGAHNINLVTPTHFILPIIEAIKLARLKGLSIPMVYNTGGYERVESLRLLEGYIDVYLPDFKYLDPKIAKKYSFTEDYPEVAKAALKEMVRQQPLCQFEDENLKEESMLIKGVLLRHLVLPGYVEHSKAVIAYLFKQYQHAVYLSIMNQYTP
ncbi:MAG: methylated-DNA--[protein]-cysteine S-methyltransferase, partial [Vallitaleaceae bacterium]|nr:methylated-DNA--[protein]-cysteine S-methyltransferase [Vallitaleaceae bacterium]